MPPPGQRPIDDLGGQIRELLDFRLPLVLDGSRGHHQHSLDPPAPPQEFGGRQRLNGFSQAHVVGQDHAAAAGRKDGPPRLIWQELGLENAIQWILAAAEFRQELPLILQPLGDLVFPVDVFQHIAVNDRLIVGFPELVEDVSEMPEILAPQESSRVEMLNRQRVYGSRC